MTGKHKWVCPECGSAVLAGKAPRQNATARYCLDCSAKSDTLVERTCPVLDRKRAESEERRRCRAAREREAAAKRKADQLLRADRAEAERKARRLDTVWAGSADLPDVADKIMRTLDERFPARVESHGDVLYLRASQVQGQIYGPAHHVPCSRSALAVLLDYAEDIGHPDAEQMRADFVKFGGMPGAESAG